ncbi:hypothetical protein ABW19_dt0205905 [Dactylella cylindrospora]|nr:hypothetical protein ABW19_dt0205905 [Dactylella cylindrospora]
MQNLNKFTVSQMLVSALESKVTSYDLQQTATMMTRLSNYDHRPLLILKRMADGGGPDSAAGEPGHGGRRTVKTSPAERRNFRITHGTLMATSFVICFPLGAILLRTLKAPLHVYIHAGTQLFATCLAMAGMGVGIWLGLNTRYLDYAHTIIGMAVVVALSVQPIIGIIHHLRFRKTKKPTWWGRVHRWFGRLLIIVGIVNGGLGLLLAENTRAGKIAYGIVAALAGLVYFVVGLLALRSNHGSTAVIARK